MTTISHIDLQGVYVKSKTSYFVVNISDGNQIIAFIKSFKGNIKFEVASWH